MGCCGADKERPVMWSLRAISMIANMNFVNPYDLIWIQRLAAKITLWCLELALERLQMLVSCLVTLN